MNRFLRRPSLKTLAHLAAVWVIIYLAWGLSFDRLSPHSWSTPINYNGDTLEVLAFVKAASEGDYIPCLSENVSRLGAPFKANWDDNPMYEPFMTFVMGMISRWFGLFTGLNMGILFAHLSAATAFFICCRLMRFRVEWASAGAVLFGLMYYISFCTRGGHMLLGFIFTLPFGVLTCWLVAASRRMKVGGAVFWLCVISGLVMGMGNPYNLNIFLQLLCLGLAAHLIFGARRRINLVCGAATLVAALFGFLAVNAHSLIYWKIHGWNPAAVPRTYGEAEFYSLRPIELVLPPDVHRVPALAAIGKYYSAQSPVNHENHAPYLGLAGGAALIWLLLSAWSNVTRRRRDRKSHSPAAAGLRPDRQTTTTDTFEYRTVNAARTRLTAYAPQTLWVLLYAVPGGGNCLLALAGILFFRGGNRFSIYIGTICLFFLVSRLSVFAKRWKPVFSYAAAGALVLVGAIDQLQKPDHMSTEDVRKAIASEEQFAGEMESKLPRGGMVFQFPAIGFPEGHPVNDMGEYELIRPYLFTKTLRFSYGFNAGRPREMWQHEIATLPADVAIQKLEGYGFSGLFINRKAFADGGQKMLNDFYALGKTNVIQDATGEQVCFVLNPSATPQVPRSEDYALVVFKRGWNNYETIWHMSGSQEATAYFVNEGREGEVFQGHFMLATVAARHVTISVNGKEATTVELKEKEGRNMIVQVPANRGHNIIGFKTDAPAVERRGGGKPVTFMVGNMEFTAKSARP